MADATLCNLTPHDIVVVDPVTHATLHTFPASGHVARVTSAQPQVHFTTVCGNVPVYTVQEFTGVEWPVHWRFSEQAAACTGVIVSMPVGQWCRERSPSQCGGSVVPWNVYGPDTSPEGVVRDGAGRIIGTKRLVQYVRGDRLA